jgi:hypothetical protein
VTLSQKSPTQRADRVAQVVEHLHCKCKALSVGTQDREKKEVKCKCSNILYNAHRKIKFEIIIPTTLHYQHIY